MRFLIWSSYLSNLRAFACSGLNFTMTSLSHPGSMRSVCGITVKKSGQCVTSNVTSSGIFPAFRSGIVL